MADMLEIANEVQETLGRTYGMPDDLDEAMVKSYANKMVCFFVSYKYGIKYGLLNCADFSYH